MPVRDPVAHIASLRKQQRLFEELERKDPHVLRHMCRVGHYEFGLNWTPVNYGSESTTAEILSAWDAGRDIEAWALYWNDTHRYLLELLQNPEIYKAIKVVGYEKLCAESKSSIQGILDFCELEEDKDLVDRFASSLKLPTYYSRGFSEQEISSINSLTEEVYDHLKSFM